MANQETKKVLTVVDKSTRALMQATAQLADILPQVQTATQLLNSLAGDIEFKQSELENLENTYANRVREKEAELSLQVKENESTVLNTLLNKAGLARITVSDLSDLEKEYEHSQREITAEIAAAVASAVKAEKANANLHVQSLESQHSVAVAQFVADAKAKDAQLAMLQQTIEDLRAQQDKDRSAQVEIAKARSGEQTNINVGK